MLKNNQRRYYLHQRIKRIASYNPHLKEVTVPNNNDKVLQNKYVIELKDKFGYNIQLLIPMGATYIVHWVDVLQKKELEAEKEMNSARKAIEALQNACNHKTEVDQDAWKLVATTHKEIYECLICKKRVTA